MEPGPLETDVQVMGRMGHFSRAKLGNGSGIDPLYSTPDVWADIVVPVDYTPPPVQVPDVNSPSFDVALGHLADQGGSVFGGNFDLNKLVGQLTTLYQSYRQASGLPSTQVRPTPGQSTRLPDGSIMRVNADGSTTIVSPNGTARTVRADGSVVGGISSGQWLPGISNGIVLGAAAIVAVLAMRKRR